MKTVFRFGKDHWKKFTESDLKIIEEERTKQHKLNETLLKQKGRFGIECRACNKPNNLKQTFCTGCSFPCTEDDIVKLPDNVFMDIIKNKPIAKYTNVVFRSDDYLAFDDKFPVSANHLDIIPTEVIEDIKSLNKSHIPMLKKLYQLGIDEFKKRSLQKKDNKLNKEMFGYKKDKKFDIEDEMFQDVFLMAGYNFPVSVKHLHLHMVLPPFKHQKVFVYPRWHSHKKVIHDLEKYGKVLTYDENPDESGKSEQKRAIDNDNMMKNL